MNKTLWTSKTFYFNLLLKLAGVLGLFVPSVNVFLGAHPSALLISVGAIGLGLRLVTHGKIVLTDDLPKV